MPENVLTNLSKDNIQVHIGKRSAAGSYCYDCGSVFHQHTSELHSGRDSDFFKYLDSCHGCGKRREERTVFPSSAGIELGFNKAEEVKKEGIGSCSSFTWTLMKHKWELQKLASKKNRKKIVEDEYGRKYTAKEFLEDQLSSVMVEYQNPTEFI